VWYCGIGTPLTPPSIPDNAADEDTG